MTLWPATSAALGVITPSGNRVVERVTIGILAQFPEISCHFSRTPVFGSTDAYPDGYDWDGMLGAAALLDHADPDLLVWNGSKAGGIRFALDDELAARVSRKLTSSTLALRELLIARNWRRIGLVTPYSAAGGAAVERTFTAEGYPCAAAVHAELADNLSYAAIPAEQIRAMCRRAAAARPDVIVAWCTNFPAAPLVAEIEAETGVPMLDSTSLAVWGALRALGIDPRPAAAWGSIFAAPDA
ncbi:MAG: aspartate/glutamate racemase family protein [Geminicoccaceae bacterium]